MKVKEILDRIKQFFTGNKVKMLPETTTTEISTETKTTFLDRLKHKEEPEKIDLEQDYQKYVEEYDRIFEELEKVTAKIILEANDIEYDEEKENLVEKAQEAKEKHIETEMEKAAKDSEKKIGNKSMVKAARAIARAIETDNWNKKVGEYVEEALSLYLQTKQKEGENQNYIATDEQKEKIETVKELIRLSMEEAQISGKLMGIRHAGETHSLLDENSAKEIEETENDIKEAEEFGEALKTKSGVRAIEMDEKDESKSKLEMKRILYVTDRLAEFLSANCNLAFVEEFKKANGKYSGYLENGGKVTNLEVVKENFVRRGLNTYHFSATKKEIEETIEEARKFKPRPAIEGR